MKYIVALLIATISVSSRADETRVYTDFDKVLNDTIVFITGKGNLSNIITEVCFSFQGTGKGLWSKESSIGYFWNYTSENDYQAVWFEPKSETMDDTVDSRYIGITLGTVTPEGFKIKGHINKKERIGKGEEENVASLALSENNVTIGVGHRYPETVSEVNCPVDLSLPTGIIIKGRVKISEMVTEYITDIAKELQTSLTENRLAHLPVSDNDPTGLWEYLDRDMDRNMAIAGGRYTLGIVPSEENVGEYDIIYIRGAEVNGSAWKEGMKKGKLIPTIFENHYNMIWYDSQMDKMTDDMHADLSQNAILSLSFPLMNSTMRFSRKRPSE